MAVLKNSQRISYKPTYTQISPTARILKTDLTDDSSIEPAL